MLLQRQLLAMMEFYPKDDGRFSYMQVMPNNEYKNRPLLPVPSEVVKEQSERAKTFDEKERIRISQQQRAEQRARGP